MQDNAEMFDSKFCVLTNTEYTWMLTIVLGKSVFSLAF